MILFAWPCQLTDNGKKLLYMLWPIYIDQAFKNAHIVDIIKKFITCLGLQHAPDFPWQKSMAEAALASKCTQPLFDVRAECRHQHILPIGSEHLSEKNRKYIKQY